MSLQAFVYQNFNIYIDKTQSIYLKCLLSASQTEKEKRRALSDFIGVFSDQKKLYSKACKVISKLVLEEDFSLNPYPLSQATVLESKDNYLQLVMVLKIKESYDFDKIKKHYIEMFRSKDGEEGFIVSACKKNRTISLRDKKDPENYPSELTYVICQFFHDIQEDVIYHDIPIMRLKEGNFSKKAKENCNPIEKYQLKVVDSKSRARFDKTYRGFESVSSGDQAVLAFLHRINGGHNCHTLGMINGYEWSLYYRYNRFWEIELFVENESIFHRVIKELFKSFKNLAPLLSQLRVEALYVWPLATLDKRSEKASKKLFKTTYGDINLTWKKANESKGKREVLYRTNDFLFYKCSKEEVMKNADITGNLHPVRVENISCEGELND